jgi:O-antigen/teichoic acid export membrane protein
LKTVEEPSPAANLRNWIAKRWQDGPSGSRSGEGEGSAAAWLMTPWRKFHAEVLAKKFGRDVGALTIANFISAALNLTQGILVARWLEPERYGVAGLAMLYPTFVYAVVDARAAVAAVKYFGEYRALGKRERALAICKLTYVADLAVACIAFLIVIIGAPAAARLLVHDPQIGGLIILYGAALLPRALVGTSNALLVALDRSPLIALIEVGSSALRMVLVIGLVLAGWEVMGVIWANAVAAAAMGLIYGWVTWVLIRRVYGASILAGRLNALTGERRQILEFFTYNNLNAFVTILLQHVDSILLGYFRGPTEVGYYRLAKNLSGVVEYVKVPLFSVSYAQLARIWSLGQRQAFRQRARELAQHIGIPLGLAVFIGAGSVPWVVPLLVGESYTPAIGATQILFVGAAVSIPFLWQRAIYLVRDLARDFLIVNAIVAIGFIALCPLMIWHWGYVGAAGAMLALQVAGTMARALWLSRRTAE